MTWKGTGSGEEGGACVGRGTVGGLWRAGCSGAELWQCPMCWLKHDPRIGPQATASCHAQGWPGKVHGRGSQDRLQALHMHPTHLCMRLSSPVACMASQASWLVPCTATGTDAASVTVVSCGSDRVTVWPWAARILGGLCCSSSTKRCCRAIRRGGRHQRILP